MARTRKIEPTTEVKLHLPTPLVAQVSLLLWSDAHGRIPHGEISKYYERLARADLERIKGELDGRREEIPAEAQGTGNY